MDIIFKDVLKRLRTERNFTQEELANRLGVTPGSIGLYEQGRREPDNDTLIQLSAIFGVSIDYLLCVDEPSTPTHVAAYGSLDDPLKQEIIVLLKNNDISNDKLALIKSIITGSYK